MRKLWRTFSAIAAVLLLGLAFFPLSETPAIASTQAQTPGCTCIAVASQYTNGSTIQGMYMQLYLNGQQVKAGYTPITFHVKANANYELSANDWTHQTFATWSIADDSSNPTGVGVASGVTWSITAFYTDPTASSSSSTSSVSSGSTPGLIVPLYAYPGSYWTELEQAKQAHPSVPVIAIINPSNGPGRAPDPTIQQGVVQLKAAGIVVYGYDNTRYGSAATSGVENQMNEYQQWYGVQGIFLDEFANNAGYESYYSTLTAYAHSLGLADEGNPGWSVPSSYFATVDSLMIYETNSLPSLSYLQGAVAGGSGPSHFSFIATEVPVPSQSYLDSAVQYTGFVWATASNPNYQDLPSVAYLNQLMNELAAA